MKRIQVLVLTAALALALALALVVIVLGRQGPVGVGDVRSVGTPDVGGPFTLVDESGRTVTDQSFAGEYRLVTFGFTYCPDVCPTTLQTMTAVMDALDADAARLRPMLISIDPARDTPEVLAEYLGHFHPRFVGLTGTADQVAAAAKAYKVYYAKAPGGAEDGDYLMDHSSLLFLMDRRGKYLAHFNHGAPVADIVAAIRGHLKDAVG